MICQIKHSSCKYQLSQKDRTVKLLLSQRYKNYTLKALFISKDILMHEDRIYSIDETIM